MEWAHRLLVWGTRSLWYIVLLSLILYPIYKHLYIGLALLPIGAAIAYLPTRTTALVQKIRRRFVSWSPQQWLTHLTIAGLILRLPFVLSPPSDIGGDFLTYLTTGQSIASGRGFGFYLFYPPGQSTWLAIWIRLLGSNLHLLTAVQCLTSLATIWVAYAAFARYSRSAAMWASATVALYPSIVLSSATLGHETLVMLLECTLFWMIQKISEKLTVRWLLLCGATIGVTSLVRPTFVIVPVLIALSLWLTRFRLQRSIVAGLVLMAAALAVIAPWTWRTYQRFHEFALVSTNFGITLLSSNHPQSDGIYMETMQIGKELNPIQQDKLQSHMAFEAIAADPARFLRLTFKRIVIMWGAEATIPDSLYGVNAPALFRLPARTLCQLGWIAFAFACWLGGPGFNRSWTFTEAPVVWSLLFTAFLFVLHAVIEPAARHHMTAIPLLAGICLPAYGSRLAPEIGQTPTAPFPSLVSNAGV